MPRLILASASPQRKALLEGLGLPFSVISSSVSEHEHAEWSPEKRAALLARLKATDVAGKNLGSIVIGCDTLVVTSVGKLLEKPKDELEAQEMLRAHSGATSIVHSALCIVDAEGKPHEGLSSSSVTFRELTEDEVQWWLGTGLWRDRSGGFQIDGPGQLMISHVEGDWTGVVGLPVYLLGQLLKESKYPLFEPRVADSST